MRKAMLVLLALGCTAPDEPHVAQQGRALATWTGGDLVFPANAPAVITAEQSTEDRFEARIVQVRGAKGMNATESQPGQTGGEANTMGGYGGDGTATQPAGRGGRNVMMSGPAGDDHGGGGEQSGLAEVTCGPATGAHSGCQGIFIGVEGVPEKPQVIQIGGPATGVPIQLFPGTFLLDGASSVVMHSRQYALYAGEADKLVLSTDNTASQLHFGASDAKLLFDGGAEFAQGVRWRRRAVLDQDTMLTIADRIVAYRTLTAPRTATLPSSPVADYDNGREWIVKDESGAASATLAIYVCAPEGLTVDGVECAAITSGHGAVRVYATSDGYFTE